jgi:hypothetical protein
VGKASLERENGRGSGDFAVALKRSEGVGLGSSVRVDTDICIPFYFLSLVPTEI